MKFQIKVDLIDSHVNTNLPAHMNWFTIKIEGVPRSVMIEFNRHRSISTNQESSRYTLKKHLKGLGDELLSATDKDEIWGKYVWLTGNNSVDTDCHIALGTLVNQLDNNSNDDVKTLTPEGLLYKGVYTMTLEAWANLYRLRSGKEVYGPFRDLVEVIKETLESSQLGSGEFSTHSQFYCAVLGARTCWDSVNQSDKGAKDKALVHRVGVKYRHHSIVENLKIRTVPHHGLVHELQIDRHYRKFIDECQYNGETLLLINMRTVLECMSDPEFVHKTEIYNIVPSEYKYLMKEDIDG